MFNKFLVPILILLLTFVVGIPAYSLKVLVLGGITEPPNFRRQRTLVLPLIINEKVNDYEKASQRKT